MTLYHFKLSFIAHPSRSALHLAPLQNGPLPLTHYNYIVGGPNGRTRPLAQNGQGSEVDPKGDTTRRPW